jgi:putative Ca2+/H+ antiporter (TMEM165/GDT1 family)
VCNPYHLQAYLVDSPLGKSGFLAAFSLVFLSEIGDKTFFIAALLAMRVGRWVSFFGSLAALTVMTGISVGIGVIFARVPDALKSSVPVGELCGVALLVFFGYKSLQVRPTSADGTSSSDNHTGKACWNTMPMSGNNLLAPACSKPSSQRRKAMLATGSLLMRRTL